MLQSWNGSEILRFRQVLFYSKLGCIIDKRLKLVSRVNFSLGSGYLIVYTYNKGLSSLRKVQVKWRN